MFLSRRVMPLVLLTRTDFRMCNLFMLGCQRHQMITLEGVIENITEYKRTDY